MVGLDGVECEAGGVSILGIRVLICLAGVAMGEDSAFRLMLVFLAFSCSIREDQLKFQCRLQSTLDSVLYIFG